MNLTKNLIHTDNRLNVNVENFQVKLYYRVTSYTTFTKLLNLIQMHESNLCKTNINDTHTNAGIHIRY